GEAGGRGLGEAAAATAAAVKGDTAPRGHSTNPSAHVNQLSRPARRPAQVVHGIPALARPVPLWHGPARTVTPRGPRHATNRSRPHSPARRTNRIKVSGGVKR